MSRRRREFVSGDGMPWSIPSEYRHVLDSTCDGELIMGRVSWEIFGADLETAHDLVVTRRDAVAGAEAVDSLETAVARGRELGHPVWIAGGASIYLQALERADALGIDALVLTTIDIEPEGDATFPPVDGTQWPIVHSEPHPTEGYTIHTHQRAR